MCHHSICETLDSIRIIRHSSRSLSIQEAYFLMKTSTVSVNAIEHKMNQDKKPSYLKPGKQNVNELAPMRKEGKTKMFVA